MEGKKGFSPSSLKGPAIFNLVCMKTLHNESGEEMGTFGGTVDMVAVCAFCKLSPSSYFVPECKSLTRRFLQFEKLLLKEMYICCFVWTEVMNF